MTETPEQQDAPEEQTAPAEPLYSADDVGRALGTSGERALAQSYFAKLGQPGITKADADAMIQAIQTGQPYPPAAPEGLQATQAEQTQEPPEGEAA